MEKSLKSEVPQFVKCGEFFSVEYKNRFLYSTRNPTKAILGAIDSMGIPKGSLVIICSPALWYGINELKEKAQDCKIIALEADENLLKIAKEKSVGIPIFKIDDLCGISKIVKEVCATGKIRRVLKIDFSAGVQFANEKYKKIILAIQEEVVAFWKNRATLIRLGKLYSKNLFFNLKKIQKQKLLQNAQKTVAKPIIVCGAGESLDKIPLEKISRDDFYIIAVDAAFCALNARGVTPDAVVAVEAQFEIQRTYISLVPSKITLFADICSRYEVCDFFCGDIFFFASKFTDAKFLDVLEKNKIINFLEPLGSVGLYATQIALKIRKHEGIPVFVCGLDFSFSQGRTHAKGTNAYAKQFFSNDRLSSFGNFEATLGILAINVQGKNGEKIFTNKAMENYAKIFRAKFSHEKNLFDITNFGIELGIKRGHL